MRHPQIRAYHAAMSPGDAAHEPPPTTPQIHDWDLTQTNLGRLLERGIPEVAILATSAIEPHNRHLPEGQDYLHTTHISRAVAQEAYEAGASVVWLPAIPYGVDANLLDFPLAIHVSQQTLDALLGDIVRSLRHHGTRKIIVVNGHGGNDLTPFVRAIQTEIDVHVFACDWWKVGADRYGDFFSLPEDHAGQMETSVALALFPELVELERAGDGVAAPFRFEALREGWVRTSRRFSRLNDHCAAGIPTGASAEAGIGYVRLVVDRLVRFVVDLSAAAIDERFPMA